MSLYPTFCDISYTLRLVSLRNLFACSIRMLFRISTKLRFVDFLSTLHKCHELIVQIVSQLLKGKLFRVVLIYVVKSP